MAKQTSSPKSAAAPKRKRASEAPPPLASTPLTSSVAESQQAKPSPKHEPTHAQIAAKAFELYQARGGGEGNELSDWLRAEGELRS